MTIIALSGKARCGKDTMANVLVSNYNFKQIAVADPLRNLCARVFYMDPKLFTDDDKKDTRMQRIYIDFHDLDAIRQIVENEWGYEVTQEAREKMEELHGEGLDTPRDCLRVVGNMLRRCVDSEIWINLTLAKIKEVGGRVVISDARFENERDVLKRLGAVLVLIKRNDNGESREHEFDLGDDDDYDVVFTNDGELGAFRSSVDLWFNTKEKEFTHYRIWKYE